MKLVRRIQQAYRNLFPPESIAADPRMEASDEYIFRNFIPGRFQDLEFVEDEQIREELRYARDNPL